ncbi:tail protein I (GpI) from prophage [Escherichia coli]|nr:tail protein I (GpI) from prophage [Escherichia coli]
MIALAKPVSRHLKALRLTYIAKGEVFTGAVSHSGDIIQVYPDATLPNPCITGGEIYCAGAIYDSDITGLNRIRRYRHRAPHKPLSV